MLLALLPALASVEVSDPTSCVDAERLDNELSLYLGDRPDLTIQVVVEGDGERRFARTEVRARKKLLWTRSLKATADDCPALPEALALSISTGLNTLPSWTWDTPSGPGDRVRGNMGFRVSTTVPVDLGIGLTGGLELRAHQSFGFWARLSLDTGIPFTVGDGAATLTSLLTSGGIQLAPRTWRVWTGFSYGTGWAQGVGFPQNESSSVPRAVLELGAGRHLIGPAFFGLRLDHHLVRARFTGPGGQRIETPLRAGFILQIRSGNEKSRRRGEVAGLGRASGSR